MCYFRICHYYRLLQDILETCKQIILLCFCFSSRFLFVGVRLVMYQSAVRLVSVFPSLSVVGHFSPLFFLLCLFLDLSLFTHSSHHSCGLHRFLQPLISLSQTFWYWLSLTLVTQEPRTFPFSFLEKNSVHHYPLYVSPCIRSCMYSASYLHSPVLIYIFPPRYTNSFTCI